MLKAKPFVKWAGGKGNLLAQLESLLPTNFDELTDVTYIEPFVGGGAMLFHMLNNHKNIRRVVINDINADLIRSYKLIKDNPNELVERLKMIEDNFYRFDDLGRRELYYAYRDQYNMEDIDPNERSALFIFLNRTCFNGLYRVNSKGQFNVPYGRYRNPIICNEEVILADHELLNRVEVVIRPSGDYKLVKMNLSRKGKNFIYFDPPYRPLSETSYFKDYSSLPFGDREQSDLKTFCDTLSDKGCLIMLSNSDSKNADGSSFFEDLYENYDFQRIYAPRFINAFPEKRIKLTEVLIRNY